MLVLRMYTFILLSQDFFTWITNTFDDLMKPVDPVLK